MLHSVMVPSHPRRAVACWRIGWTLTTVCLVQTVVCGLSLLPVLLLWSPLVSNNTWGVVTRALVISLAAVPSYALFALALMILSPLSLHLTRWRTAPDAEMRIADLDWPLLDWVRHMVATHLVRVFAGTLFRGTPVWTAYLRLAGARLGRRVYVSSLSLSDYNLLEFGDDVVIGDGAHISGHTVEGGVVKTGRIRLGSHVTVGLGTVIDIDVEVGPNTEIGALSLVPKHTTLEGDAVYVGIPARRVSPFPRPPDVEHDPHLPG